MNLEDDGTAVLKNGKLTVSVGRSWTGSRIEFKRDGKTILSTREEHDLAVRYPHLEGDNYRTRVYFDAYDEHIYGLGQEQQGFLWNNPSPGMVEFGFNHTVWRLHANTKSAVFLSTQ